MIKNCGAHYTEKLNKIIEIKGERLEQYRLNQIQKEGADKENEETEKKIIEKNGEKESLKMKIVYNDKRLGILTKRNS